MDVTRADYRQAILKTRGALEASGFRLYSRLRFWMLRTVYFEKIGRMLPATGAVLDVACGPGLFTNVFAQVHPDCRFYGFDLDGERLKEAAKISERVGVSNTRFAVEDLNRYDFPDDLAGVFLFFVLHHIPREEAIRLLLRFNQALPEGGVVVIKEVLDRPLWEMYVTLLWDRLRFGDAYVNFLSEGELCYILRTLGFDFQYERLRDFLPFPQALFYARKARRVDAEEVLRHLMPGGEYHPRHLDPEACRQHKSR